MLVGVRVFLICRKPPPMSNHDQNFKNLILDYPRQALEFFAPEEARHIPADATITPIREEQLKERLGDRFFELDVPLLVEWKDGSREALVFCIEEDSRPDEDHPLRHAIYCIQLARLLKTRRVVPVAIYPFHSKPFENKFKLAGDFGVYLEFNGISIRLRALESNGHLDTWNIVECLCLPLMAHKPEDNPGILAKAIHALATLEENRDKQLKYLRFIALYAEATEAEAAAVFDKVSECNPMKEDYMSILQVVEARGELKGEIKGEIKGKIKGEIEGEIKGQAKGKAAMLATLFKSGAITADTARTSLVQLLQRQEISSDLYDATLADIDSSNV